MRWPRLLRKTSDTLESRALALPAGHLVLKNSVQTVARSRSVNVCVRRFRKACRRFLLRNLVRQIGNTVKKFLLKTWKRGPRVRTKRLTCEADVIPFRLQTGKSTFNGGTVPRPAGLPVTTGQARRLPHHEMGNHLYDEPCHNMPLSNITASKTLKDTHAPSKNPTGAASP
jgi:hypothetical protein